MADKKSTVSIIFQGEDKVTQTIGKISSGLDGLGGIVTNAAQPLADLAEGIIAIDAALAGMVAGGLAVAVKESGTFNDLFNEITTLFEAGKEDIAAFRKEILDYGRDSKKSYEDIEASIYNAISAGADYREALDLVSVAEKASIAGKSNLNDALVLIASTLNAYGENFDQAGRYSDVFFKIVEQGQTTLPKLAASLGSVTGLADSAGIPIETLGAAVAALTKATGKTPESITALKAAISNIIKPSGEAEKTAAALGIQFNATALKTKGLEGVLKDVYTATDGNIEKMGKLFGSTEALNAVLILGADKSGNFATALDAMRNAAGATDRAYEKMADNFALYNQNMANNLKATLIDIGTPLLNEYGDIAQGISNIFKGISIGIDDGAFDDVFDALEDFGDRMADFLNKVAKNLPEALDQVDFSGLLEALKDLGAAIGSYFGDIDLTTVEGLRDFIQGVVDGLEGLTNITTGMTEQFRPFIQFIQKAISEVKNMDAETQKGFGNILAAAELVVQAGWKVAAFMAVLKASGADIGHVWDVVAGSIKFGWNALQTAFDEIAGAIVNGCFLINDALASITWGERSEHFKERAQYFKEWLDAIDLHKAVQTGEMLDGFQQAVGGITGETHKATDWAKKFGVAVDDVGKKVKNLPDKKTVTVSVKTKDARSDIEGFGQEVESSIQDKTVALKVDADLSKAFDEVDAYSKKLARKEFDITSVVRVAADGKDAEEVIKYLKGENDTLLDKEKLIKIAVALGDIDTFKRQYFSELSSLPSEKQIEIIYDAKAKIDGQPKKFEDITWFTASGERKTITVPIKPNVDQVAAKKTEDTLNNLTSDKMMEIRLKGDIDTKLASIKATAATVQKSVEWKAKVDIAQAEAGAKKIKAAFEAVNNTINSTGDVIGGIVDKLADISMGSTRSALERQLRLENDIREEAHKKTMELMDVQIRMEEERLKRMKSGKAIYTVEAANLSPHLEAIWVEVIRAVQIRAEEEGFDALIGMN